MQGILYCVWPDHPSRGECFRKSTWERIKLNYRKNLLAGRNSPIRKWQTGPWSLWALTVETGCTLKYSLWLELFKALSFNLRPPVFFLEMFYPEFVGTVGIPFNWESGDNSKYRLTIRNTPLDAGILNKETECWKKSAGQAVSAEAKGARHILGQGLVSGLRENKKNQ